MTVQRLTLLPVAEADEKTPAQARPARITMLPVTKRPAELTDVVSIQRMASGGRWRTEAMRSYSRPTLIWFTRGQGRLSVAGRTTGYTAHSAIFLPAGTMHGFTVTPATLGFVLHLPRAHGSSWPTEPRHLKLRDVQQQRELTAMIDGIEKEAGSRAPGAAEAVEHRTGLLSIWFARTLDAYHEPDTGRPSDSGEALTAAFTSLVEREFRNPVGVQYFAAALGVTPTHLSRVTRRVSGRAALEILSDRRHFEACQLLVGSTSPISDIAVESGFASPAYFTRAFRARSGCSPSEFRKAHGEQSS